MTDKSITGKITFIHHEKNRAVVEYIENGRKKTIQADISVKLNPKSPGEKINKKQHRFLIGDTVKFTIKKTGSNGSILYASPLQYQYNTTLELILNKVITENKFLGYIKIVDNEFFIKEIESYLFFPLLISNYEIPPAEAEIADPVYFKLDTEKPEKITAKLYNRNYLPEFSTAVQLFKKQLIVKATVQKITPFGIHVNLIDNKLDAKLSIDETLQKQIEEKSIMVGSEILVKIKHLSDTKIIIEKATDAGE